MSLLRAQRLLRFFGVRVRCVGVDFREKRRDRFGDDACRERIMDRLSGRRHKWHEHVRDLSQSARRVRQNFGEVLGRFGVFFAFFGDFPRFDVFEVLVE